MVQGADGSFRQILVAALPTEVFSVFGWLKRIGSHGSSRALGFRHLLLEQRYHVVRAFTDHDGIIHPAGESWTFLRSTFLPYEDGLSLFVRRDGGAEMQIRLQWRAEAEEAIIDALDDYIQPAPHGTDAWSLVLTRDSVCMADDVEAIHEYLIDVACDADAADVASAILKASYLAWVGGKATWSLTLGQDRVVFGQWSGQFILPVRKETFTARADTVDRLHVTYLMQADPADIVARMMAER